MSLADRARRLFTVVEGRELAELIADRDFHAKAANRLEDECARLRTELLDREAMIAKRPVWRRWA